MTLLQLSGVSKRFGNLQALDGIDMTVNDGEIRAVIGPNGAGKTTLFNVLTGVYEPTGGEIRLRGKPITDTPEYERPYHGISRAYQVNNPFESMTVYENLQTAVALYHNNYYDLLTPLDGNEQVAARTDSLLQRCDLADQCDTDASALSYGGRRRLEIGMALASEPKLLLLDEPTAGTDMAESDRIIDIVEEFVTDTAVVLVEHDIELVMDISDQITVLERGQVIADGPPDAITENERVQQAYLGGESSA